MNKYSLNSLSKKIEFFEKMATYGDRSSFLKSIAQTKPNDKFYNVRRFLQLAKDTIKNNIANELDPSSKTLFSSVTQSPESVSAAEQQIQVLNSIWGRLRSLDTGDIYDDRPARIANEVSGYLSLAKDSLKPLKDADFEASLVSAPQPTATQDVGSEKWNKDVSNKIPIDPQAQIALNKLFPTMNLKADGIIGPQTASALQMYKNQYNNTKHPYNPMLHVDVINSAKDKQSGLLRKTPF